MNNKALLLIASTLAVPLTASAQDTFLSDPSLLESDPRFGVDLVYLPSDVEERMRNYDSVMVDEPEVFIAPDSPYGGFKASDMAALTSMVRVAYIEGFTNESTNLQVVDEASPSTLYLRLALKNVYVKKKKKGLFAYTPVGAVVKGVHDVASDAIDKTTLVELTVEGEMHDSLTKATQAAFHIERGQRKDSSHKEAAAHWEITGAIAEALGHRLACQLDNVRSSEAQKRDCFAEIPMPAVD